jgi:uncharacterized protein YqgC (DUF456 family)
MATAGLIALSIVLFGMAVLTVIPILPIVPAQFILILIFSILTSFYIVSGGELIVFGGVAFISILVDYSAGAVGARLGGAHRWSVMAGIFGGIFGSIFFPPFGAFIAIPVFVFFSELVIKKLPKKSMRTAGFSLLGTVGGVIANGLLAFTTAVLFLIFVF